MYSVELYSRVRRACHVDGMSKSAAARHFGIDRKTVSKILKHAVPPGYRRNGPPARPKLDPFIPLINQILEEDKSRLKKQRHTSKRIYERLRDEHGFVGGITIVTDYVRERKRRTREVFVPLSHAPGHAQVDFGEALGEIGGVVRKLHYFAMSLPHSDAFFIKAYPAETTEAFCDGHVAGFAFFGGVPLSGLYDNTTIAVAPVIVVLIMRFRRRGCFLGGFSSVNYEISTGTLGQSLLVDCVALLLFQNSRSVRQ